MNALTPDSFIKRHPLYHSQKGIAYTERDQGSVALAYAANESKAQLEQCALVDLSGVYRTGLRGRHAQQVLEANQFPFPEKPNTLMTTADGALVARVGFTECWLLDNPLETVPSLKTLAAAASETDYCYPLACQHSHIWFALTGVHVAKVMAKVCGVDLRESSFPVGAITQTYIARVSGVIMHHQIDGIPVFSIMSDTSTGEYLWYALLDAMQEFDGQPVGLAAFS